MTINGRPVEIPAGHETAVEVLREGLDLTGTKLVCGTGVCGACTISVGGVPVNSCLRSGHARAAELATEGATPLPLTGHKMRLLQNVVLDTVRGALAGDALSELAVGERPLPARPIPG